jgi:hypothetical protein
LIVGIYAPEEQIDELKEVYAAFNENKACLYRFLIMATSPKLFVDMAGVFLKKDIDNLPYPANQIKLSEVDKIVIEDVITYQFGRKKELLKPAKKSDAIGFADVFCKVLNTMYKSKDKGFFLFKLIISKSYFILHFEYGKPVSSCNTENDNLDNYLDRIMPRNTEPQDSYRIKKILKIYGDDRLIIVKPKDKKYWLRSIALRDADDTISEYIEVRHNND